MERSPLTQQSRPEAFEPKVIQLYRALLQVCRFLTYKTGYLLTRSQDREDDEKPEGFWRELFLLKPDTNKLAEMLDDMDAVTLIHIQVQFSSFQNHTFPSLISL